MPAEEGCLLLIERLVAQLVGKLGLRRRFFSLFEHGLGHEALPRRQCAPAEYEGIAEDRNSERRAARDTRSRSGSGVEVERPVGAGNVPAPAIVQVNDGMGVGGEVEGRRDLRDRFGGRQDQAVGQRAQDDQRVVA
jgi:hypothetical protein